MDALFYYSKLLFDEETIFTAMKKTELSSPVFI